MVTKYGMSEKLGPLQYGKTDELIFLGRQIQEEKNYSEETSKLIDSEVHDIVDRARRRAYELLTQYRSLLDAVVARLIEQETLSSDEFNTLVDGHLGQLPVAASTSGGTTPPSGAPAGGAPEAKRRPDPGTGKGPAPAPTPA
jgi:cell division protease FtsH